MASNIIVRNPAILSGEPVFRGTRVPFKALTDYLEHDECLPQRAILCLLPKLPYLDII